MISDDLRPQIISPVISDYLRWYTDHLRLSQNRRWLADDLRLSQIADHLRISTGHHLRSLKISAYLRSQKISHDLRFWCQCPFELGLPKHSLDLHLALAALAAACGHLRCLKNDGYRGPGNPKMAFLVENKLASSGSWVSYFEKTNLKLKQSFEKRKNLENQRSKSISLQLFTGSACNPGEKSPQVSAALCFCCFVVALQFHRSWNNYQILSVSTSGHVGKEPVKVSDQNHVRLNGTASQRHLIGTIKAETMSA